MKKLSIYLSLICILFAASLALGATQIGYTLNFNNLRSSTHALQCLDLAQKAGAQVISVIPPAHIWEDGKSEVILDSLFDEADKRHMKIIIQGVDAKQSTGTNYLYQKVLSESSTPVSNPSLESIIGNPEYEKWLNEETRYYASTYGKRPSMAGFTIGIFSETFSQLFIPSKSQAGQYQFIQRSSYARTYWLSWLQKRVDSIDLINRDYRTSFNSFDDLPIPANDWDNRYPLSEKAYFDYLRAMNDWLLSEFDLVKTQWHNYSEQPVIWHLDGNAASILASSGSAHGALDVQQWMEMADVVGVSLYSDSKQADGGLSKIQSTLSLVGISSDKGKPLYVMASGVRNSTGEPGNWLRDLPVRISLPLQPELIINAQFMGAGVNGKEDPRFMINAAGSPIETGYARGKATLTSVQNIRSKRVSPYLYIVSSPLNLRGDMLAGDFQSMVHQAAGYLPMRWANSDSMAFIPSQSVVMLSPAWKSTLKESFLQDFVILAKKRQWIVMLDEQDKSMVRNAIGSEIKGATIDLAGFLEDTTDTDPALGFSKAIVEFYEAQTKSVPNHLSPDKDRTIIPTQNGLILMAVKQQGVPAKLHLTLSQATQGQGFGFNYQPRDAQPIIIELPVPTGKYLWQVTGSDKSSTLDGSLPSRQTENSWQFIAQPQINYFISTQKSVPTKETVTPKPKTPVKPAPKKKTKKK